MTNLMCNSESLPVWMVKRIDANNSFVAPFLLCSRIYLPQTVPSKSLDLNCLRLLQLVQGAYAPSDTRVSQLTEGVYREEESAR
jgi:hypothetical protein